MGTPSLLPIRITELPEYTGSDTSGYVPYAFEGRTYKVMFGGLANNHLSDNVPKALGTAGPGVGFEAARWDHIHPAINLSDPAQITGTIPASKGGTGQNTYTNGDLLIGNVSGGLSRNRLIAGANITLTYGDGTITIAATGGGGGSGTVTSVDLSGGTTGLTVTGGPITTSGVLTLAGTVNVANGGTGANTLTGYVKGNGTGPMTASATIPATDIAAGAAITKTDDTNVTLTLGGTPTTAVLKATSFTLGWSGTLAVARGGTGAGTLTGYVKGNGASAMTASASIPLADVTGAIGDAPNDGNQYVRKSLAWAILSGGGGLSDAPSDSTFYGRKNAAWVNPTAADITAGAALTKTDDTNVTLTLGGTPATALLVATSLTLGWTGVLAPARGGTGAGILTQGSVDFIGAAGVQTQDNANFFWDNTNKRLGIGTNAPTAALHTGGDVKFGFAGSVDTYNIGFYGRSPAGGTVDWDIKTNDATNGAKTPMTIKSTGFVGINGVTAPSSALHVSGDIVTNAGNLKLGVDHNGGSIVLDYASASAASRAWQIVRDYGVYGDFAINTAASQGGAITTNRFYINTAGVVSAPVAACIGTTTQVGTAAITAAGGPIHSTGAANNINMQMRYDASGGMFMFGATSSPTPDLLFFNNGGFQTAKIGNDGSFTAVANVVAPNVNTAIGGFCSGVPTNSEVVAGAILRVATTIVAGSCSAIARVAATASTVFTIYKQTGAGSATTVGTFTFAAAGKVATVSISAGAITAGDFVFIQGPATADATLADIGFLVTP